MDATKRLKYLRRRSEAITKSLRRVNDELYDNFVKPLVDTNDVEALEDLLPELPAGYARFRALEQYLKMTKKEEG